LAAIPVLMYHHINPNDGDMITVTPEAFEEHLRSIKKGGYKTLGLNELMGFMDGTFRCDKKTLVITFDDGYLDNFIYAFPLLKKYNQRAVIFAVTDWLDGATNAPIDEAGLAEYKKKPPTHNETKSLVQEGSFSKAVMNWDMAREMHESGLVEIASHTATHGDCDTLSDKKLECELKNSKKKLEEKLKTPCEYLCWPRGKFSEGAIKAAKKAGYKGCFTTNHGIVREGSDPFTIKRIVVKAAPKWVGKRLAIYTNAILSRLYLGIKGKGR